LKVLNLAFLRCRFSFEVVNLPVYFPPGKAANVIRGALGQTLRAICCPTVCRDSSVCVVEPECLYRTIFAPKWTTGPSGFADPPRPFVLRCRHLDGQQIGPREIFALDVHIFDVRPDVLRAITVALAQLAHEGLGPGRGSVVLKSASTVGTDDVATLTFFQNGTFRNMPISPIVLDLSAGEPAVSVEVCFISPVELKGVAEPSRPDFSALFARLRDRISSLRALYGAGPLEIDFRTMGERAHSIRLEAGCLRSFRRERRSSRTGQSHPIGGWTGTLRYSGDLTEFLPFLRVGQWTGVGRQTVWGKGEFEVSS
jgi:hypothetical protein